MRRSMSMLHRETPIAARVDVVGPEPMTTDALTASMRRRLGLAPAPIVRLPRWMLGAVTRLKIGPVTHESLAMLEGGGRAADRRDRAGSGNAGRGVGADAGDRRRPAGCTVDAARPCAALAGIVVTLGYTAILAVTMPALWADPFGALVKNAAIIGLALAAHALETDHG